ncbi:Na(+)/H(+) antiporter subunit B [Halobacillus sp. Marseille-Q1614]|uniref:Na(+)/H(+) antiporter subunit B n=1 Tax=Halobacillus sp. Marseille-Q1614 TaxID=2709134 RepID=UPI0015714325|nr:Na(+)/H(+) antiporter subunit B [Halobacillus sp. Marseille-Q1614]
MKESNDLILRTMTALIAFILMGFSIYLFFAGHNKPGGGFIGGLTGAAALILMYMAYGENVMKKIIPIDYMQMVFAGLIIAAGSGIGAFLFNAPFLSHSFGYFQLPILGRTELATAMIFDLGVYLTCIGITMTIILTASSDTSAQAD